MSPTAQRFALVAADGKKHHRQPTPQGGQLHALLGAFKNKRGISEKSLRRTLSHKQDTAYIFLLSVFYHHQQNFF